MHWPRPYWCPLSAVAGRWSEWINSFWKGRPCVGIQLSKELIPNSDGGRRWNGLIDRSVTRICSEVGDRKKVGGLVGLDIFGHQEGKEHQLTRILIQPQLLSNLNQRKCRFWDFFLSQTDIELPEVFHLYNQLGKESSSVISSYFGPFDSYCILWGQIWEENLVNAQLSSTSSPRKQGWYESQSMLIIRNCAKNVHMVKSLSSIKWIKKCHKTANPKWLISLLKLLRLLMTHLPGVIERLWQKPATRQLCHLFDLR